MPKPEFNWMEATGGYSIALDGNGLICKSSKDKLRDIRDYLPIHAKECKETVDAWMTRSLPIPRRVLQAVWLDPWWQRLIFPWNYGHRVKPLRAMLSAHK
jgi:hypothetical protein